MMCKVIFSLLLAVLVSTSDAVRVKRLEIRAMTDAQFNKYAAAVNQLKANGEWDALAKIHQDLFQKGIHRSAMFLPWHRMFLNDLEDRLQKVANDSTIFVPYWDWTLDAKNVTKSVAFSAKRFGGFSGASQKDACIKTGPFTGFTPCITRNQEYATTGWDVVDVVNAYGGARGSAAYSTMTQGVEGIHNLVHVGVGGVMGSSRSPYDPIFYSHHAMIDKIWLDWQRNATENRRAFQGDASTLILGYESTGVKVSDMFASKGYSGKSVLQKTLRAVDLVEDFEDESEVPSSDELGKVVEFGVSSAGAISETALALLKVNPAQLKTIPRRCGAPRLTDQDFLNTDTMWNTEALQKALRFSQSRERAGAGVDDTCVDLLAVRSAIGDSATGEIGAATFPVVPVVAGFGGLLALAAVYMVAKRRSSATQQPPSAQGVQMGTVMAPSSATNPRYQARY